MVHLIYLNGQFIVIVANVWTRQVVGRSRNGFTRLSLDRNCSIHSVYNMTIRMNRAFYLRWNRTAGVSLIKHINIK